MTGSLKILMVASECVPFAKTGGLGDVVGALPRFLKKLGHEVVVVIPGYSFIDTTKHEVSVAIEKMDINMLDEKIIFSVRKSNLQENVPVYLVDYEPFFGRPNIYHDNNYNDYPDNPKRFTFLSRAALHLCKAIDYVPDIVHANDWHTAVIPAYLKTLFRDDPVFGGAACVLTIHNIAYQGRYDRYFFYYSGLNHEDFTPEKFECFNDVNFLKGGIHFADMVNTVSKGYASETRTQPGGYGLDYFLNKKADNYIGILNGVDYAEWDPAVDKMIPASYSWNDMTGKAVCKDTLQDQLGLKRIEKMPVIGIISRFAEQKGFHILSECIEAIVNNMDVQFAILGSGDKQMEAFYGYLQERHKGRVGLYIGYNNELAHLIEAGSDFFLMPSLYEPCGLNQIYSLKYGTLPIVRATGGLNDTIENYDQETGAGTGFKFWEPSGKAIYNTVSWALDTYQNRRSHMQKLIQKAMKQNFSWEKSAAEYVRLYKMALKNRNVSMPA